MSARTARGQRIEAAYLEVIRRQTASVSAANVAAVDAYRASRRAANQPLVAPPTVPTLSQPSPSNPTPTMSTLANIIGAVGNAVGGIFGNQATATGPSATSTLGSVANTVGSVIGAVLPGGPAINSAVALSTLPGRATAGGMSEYLLERPTGGGGSAVARLGIPAGWTRKKIKALVRYVGPGQAAAIIGAPLESVAIIAVSTHSRSRGISARELRTTKRVTRRILGMARDLAALRPAAPRRSFGRSATKVICN